MLRLNHAFSREQILDKYAPRLYRKPVIIRLANASELVGFYMARKRLLFARREGRRDIYIYGFYKLRLSQSVYETFTTFVRGIGQGQFH